MKLPDWNALNIRWNEWEEKVQWLEDMVMDAIERPKMLLFDLSFDTNDYASEYGCVFLVAAKDEAEAKEIVIECMDDWAEGGYTLVCCEVGFAHAEEAGIVSRFIT